MGFAVGGSFVAAYQIPLSQYETGANSERNNSEQETEENATQHSKKAESLWVPIDSVGLYTLVLAVFTGLLVGVSGFQGWFLLRADKTARITANAADKSARASIGIQLPILRVNPDKLSHGEYASGVEIIEECSVYSVTVWNLGSTKAFPKEVLYGWAIGEELPPEPKYQFTSAFDIHSIIVPNGTAFIKNLSGVKLLQAREWSRICAGNYLWFYCCIIYDDFMDETRSHGFCWKWASTGMGVDWRVEKAAAYNKKNAALSDPPLYP